MKFIQQLKLIELLAFYLGLFVIYVALPSPLSFLRHGIAPLMVLTIAIIFLNTLGYLNRQ